MVWSEWKAVRGMFARYMEAAKARGETQKTVATKGGMYGQNAISKLLDNDNQGPAVETFLKAIKGLGLTPSEFFAELERDSPPTHASSPTLTPAAPPAPPADTALHKELLDRQVTIRHLLTLFLSDLQKATPPPRRRKRR